jgi:ornithine cyclodeaminase
MKHLAMMGAGSQAPWQVRAIASVAPLERVTVWAPSPRRRGPLAKQLGPELGIEVRAVEDRRQAIADADIICCATTATTPIVEADDLADRPVLVVAVGAFRPDMAEFGTSVLQRAGRVYVDDVAAALEEAGDVIGALKEGVIAEEGVLPVGRGPASPPAGVIVFKSVGSAVEDAAVVEVFL